MEKPPLYEITVSYSGRSFTMNRKNTALCYYDNEMADHILHQWGDPEEPNTLVLPKTGNEILFNTLELMDVTEVWRDEPEEYVELFMGALAVEACEMITQISAMASEMPDDWFGEDYVD